ncbi:AAA family ATPase [Rhizobium laguerreae]|uniref:AAA family ATPase n=1 Tax=Rhizobium laguerreae TaxID=1076926 RepID=UPI001C910F48|nr:AAA family ATPase [Rhizobium laguerreae]MBY3386533.1 AAA family ATPase [Rhizobium laguerreae]MBY3400616.1 AAA family ATPase [Rhizobium laguerreae]MBY3407554.1 AAA family ATPase [Rhizobium laguerreae]
MRINRLDLTRYGKFTDAIIDFGARPVGSTDLHVVYGPNEAGKSTTLDAILDLIFGIGNTTKYDFQHPYNTMRLGANVQVAGQDRDFVRIKRPQNSLLDGEERSLADTEIRADLGGIDREAFSTMFSLDDITLEKGGENILASKGDLGELLFSASAGLSDLSRQLLAIRGDADNFYKLRGRGSQLSDLKVRLKDLKQKHEDLDVQATEYRKRLAELHRLEGQYDQALTERANTQRRADEINRTLRALPTMRRLTALRGQFDTLDTVSDPPKSWKLEFPQIRKEEIKIRVKLDEIARNVAEIEKEIDGIVDDGVALDLVGRAHDLIMLEPRYLTAQVDIPKLAGRVVELSVETLLLQLGKADEKTPARLVLDAAIVGKFRALISARSGVEAHRTSAAEELAKAERALRDEGERISLFEDFRSPARIRAFEVLSAMVKALPKSFDEAALRSLTRRRESADVVLSESLAQLAPWRGSPADLAAMSVPSTVKLDDWKTRFREGREGSKTARAELERFEPDARRMDAEIDVLRVRAGEIEESSVAASRAAREKAWISHRQTLDAQSADAFEHAMRADDQLVSQRLLHFAEASKLAQLMLSRASLGSDIDAARERLEAAARSLSELGSEMAAALALSSGDFSLDPAEVEEWLRKRTFALRARDDLWAINQEVTDIRDRAQQSKNQLLAAIKGAGLTATGDADLVALYAVAEDALDAFNLAMDQADRLERLEENTVARTRAMSDAQKAADEWDAKWSELCSGCWLGEASVLPDVDEVNGILHVLDKLASAIEARDGLVDRIEKMEKDSVLFEASVFELCDSLEIRKTASLTELTRTIGDRIKAALRGREQREKLGRDVVRKREEERELLVTKEILDVQIGKMTAFFGCATLDEVEALIDLSSKCQVLRSSITELEQELVEIGGANDIGEVEEKLASVNRGELEDQLALLTPILEDQDRKCHDVFHERSTIQKAIDAIGGDSAVAEIEEQRRTILLEIEERAGRYLELRAGITAAEQALRLYRDRHRSGMMTRASEAFRTMSRGAYTGVAAQPGKDGEVLIAVSANGGSKAADELSKGARFQLYLALRVAGYHEFVSNRAPIPFIADDIMETFDDFRAEEAFRLFAEMAGHGQVIYLTHHRHLTEIARKVCPGVRLHDLETIHSGSRISGIAAE